MAAGALTQHELTQHELTQHEQRRNACVPARFAMLAPAPMLSLPQSTAMDSATNTNGFSSRNGQDKRVDIWGYVRPSSSALMCEVRT